MKQELNLIREIYLGKFFQVLESRYVMAEEKYGYVPVGTFLPLDAEQPKVEEPTVVPSEEVEEENKSLHTGDIIGRLRMTGIDVDFMYLGPYRP